ncbi:MAG: PEGA domain-containing protein [Myxococcales bacterium]|nr:PEGA domain-containing protein [Myxococcales bacterium]
MGQQFGKFQLLKKIATGGMAEIHLAKQRGMEGFEKLVVIKMILPHLANNQEFVQMFLDEARIAARLNHPNIVQIFDLGRAGGTYFIAMEYIQGENLRTIAKTARKAGKPLPLSHIVKIMSQACEGLYYAHTKQDTSGKPLNIVHRDISPQNILVSFDGVTKLVDFGIAKAATQVQETRSGVLKGKYAYMSPEQCLGRPVDARSDIFATGIVLWELATGTRLYKMSSELLILKEITEGRIVPPREVNQTIPAELEAIILKALEKDPKNRFQDAIQMHLALEEFMRNSGLSSSAVHLANFLKELFPNRLEGLRKIEEAQAAGDSLESFLFDDVAGEGSGVITPSGPSAVTDPSRPLMPKATTGVSRVGPRPVVKTPSGTTPRPSVSALTVPAAATPLPPPPPPARAPGWLKGALAVLLLLVLGGGGFFVYLKFFSGPPPEGPVDAGVDGGTLALSRRAGIRVTSDPTGAEVRINGERRGVTPLALDDLEIGTPYTLEVSKPPLKAFSTQFRLDEPGEQRPFNARLEAAVAGFGWVEVVTAPPGARLELDGKPLEAQTPTTIGQVASGVEHTLRATFPGRKDWVQTFRLQPNERITLTGNLVLGDVKPLDKAVPVVLRSRPNGARFFLDDAPVEGDTVRLEPGRRYRLTAKLAGYKDWSEDVTGGKRRTVVAAMVPTRDVPPPPPPPGEGKARLSVQSNPWAIVYLDGKKLGQTPISELDIPAGPHELHLVNSQLDISKDLRVNARVGETVKVNHEFAKGFLLVKANPWAQVKVGGRSLGTTPFDKKELFEGSYTVVLENSTLERTIEKRVTIRAGETTVLEVNFLE